MTPSQVGRTVCLGTRSRGNDNLKEMLVHLSMTVTEVLT